MSRDEVNTGAALLDLRQELRDPCRSGRARTSDPQRGINRLDRFRSQIVELEICFPIGTFPKTGEVGLVPDLKVPGAYLVSSVTLLDMPDESIDKIVPTIRFRMRCIAVPIEDAAL